MASRRKAAQIISEGKSPLDRLMADLDWWAREVKLLEEKIRNDPASPVAGGESILRLERTGIIKSFFDAKDSLHECALDAAQYVHPTFRAVAVAMPGQQQLQPNVIEAEVIGDETEREQRAYLSVIKGGRG
jgi:hypothetical protein